LPDRRLPIAAIEVTAKAAAAIKRAIRIEAAETGEATTTADTAVLTARGQAPVAIRQDQRAVQAQVRAGATATTTRQVLAAVLAPTGKTRLAHAVDPARRRIVVAAGGTAAGAIVTTTRPVGVAVLAPTGKTRPAHAADQAHRLIVAVAAIGVTAGVATTTGVMVGADVTATGVMVAADVATTTGATDVAAAETAGVMAAGTVAMAGATTVAVGQA
jgi:hypothetical protein